MGIIADGIKSDQFAGQVKAGNLLATIVSDGIGFNRAGPNGIDRLERVTLVKQYLIFLQGVATFNNVIKPIKVITLKTQWQA